MSNSLSLVLHEHYRIKYSYPEKTLGYLESKVQEKRYFIFVAGLDQLNNVSVNEVTETT